MIVREGAASMLSKWLRKRNETAVTAGGTEKASTDDLAQIEVAIERIGGPHELQWMFLDVSPADIRRALDAWRWLEIDYLTVIAVSAFGDILFRAPDSTIQLLDTVEGRLKQVAISISELSAKLQETDQRDALLLAGFVIAARHKGLQLEPGECYDFRIAPILGGEFSSDAMEKLSFVVKLHLCGQLHEQVKDLPDGTRISGFAISD